jgi:hypothetical protein
MNAEEQMQVAKDMVELTQAAMDKLDEKDATITIMQQRIQEALRLIDIAVCPCCDKSGGYYINDGEAVQCQWCDEVNKLKGDNSE